MGLIGNLMKSMHAPVYRSRLAGLVKVITPELEATDRVLDVGCGNGQLGRALMDALPGLEVAGLERAVRDGAAIEVSAYDGITFPFEDNTFDAVIVADVVHHDAEPLRVLRECRRVAKRLVILKDHKVDGPAVTLPYRRICLMDWAANVQYGIPCLYDYPTREGWHERFAEIGAEVQNEHTRLQLYPRPYRWFFTPRLQYLTVINAAPAPAPGMAPATAPENE
ncbi:MAG: class I SAM-dependent methyltransferase [Planctomycetota bacterium]